MPPAQAMPFRAGCLGPPVDIFLIISEEGDFRASLGNPCLCLVTFTAQNCLLLFRGNIPYYCLYPLPLPLTLGTTKKSLASSSLYPPFRCIYTLIRLTLRSSFAKLLSSWWPSKYTGAWGCSSAGTGLQYFL